MTAIRLPPQGVYGITPARLCADPAALYAAVAAALAGGLALLQYRDKLSPPQQRQRLAQGLLQRCAAAGVPLIINDDVELALAVGAAGVHIGLADASLAQARARLGSAAIIGVSCATSLARAQAAQDGGAGYVAFGAFYPSSTKPNAPAARLELLAEAKARIRLPLVAIGGITAGNAAPLVAAGADYLAAVEGVFGAGDITAAVRSLAALFPGQA